jgi:lipid-binding SYLF domain-containing protein
MSFGSFYLLYSRYSLRANAMTQFFRSRFMNIRHLLTVLAVLTMLPLSANAASREEQRASIQSTRADVLTQLYKVQPQAQKEIANSYGYAVFSNAGVTAFFLTAAYGYGVARINPAGPDTYMQMAAGGVGLGLGVKDFKAVFLFRDKAAYDNFVTQGVDFSGQADAAAKVGTKGGAVGGAADVLPGVRVYQLTHTGLALQATLQGTKYWKDADLNSTVAQNNTARHQTGYNN